MAVYTIRLFQKRDSGGLTIAYNPIFVEEEFDLHIAQSIGPLIKCMCDDNRQFFKSNRHWHGTIQSFAALVHSLISSKKVIKTLIRYEGLLEAIVQWRFGKITDLILWRSLECLES